MQAAPPFIAGILRLCLGMTGFVMLSMPNQITCLQGLFNEGLHEAIAIA